MLGGRPEGVRGPILVNFSSIFLRFFVYLRASANLAKAKKGQHFVLHLGAAMHLSGARTLFYITIATAVLHSFFFCLSRDVDAAVRILSRKSSAMACYFAGYMPERFEESRNEHFLLHLGPVIHPQTWPSFKVAAEVKSAPGDPPAAFCCSD